MFLVRVVVGEQVDAEADAPGHGDEGDALPLLHVSCVRRGEGIGLVRLGSRVPLWGSSQRAKKKTWGGVPGSPRVTCGGDGVTQSANAKPRIGTSTTLISHERTRASTPEPSTRGRTPAGTLKYPGITRT